MKILVIDDDKRLLAEVARMLAGNGHSADCVDNADDALAMVKANHYDFVLVDYRMPEHDGIWFLKNARLPRSTKALVVTSFVESGTIRKMFNAGVTGYVTKPFDEEELIRHLDFHSGKRNEPRNIEPA